MGEKVVVSISLLVIDEGGRMKVFHVIVLDKKLMEKKIGQ
jgi:hypothetical protein